MVSTAPLLKNMAHFWREIAAYNLLIGWWHSVSMSINLLYWKSHLIYNTNFDNGALHQSSLPEQWKELYVMGYSHYLWPDSKHRCCCDNGYADHHWISHTSDDYRLAAAHSPSNLLSALLRYHRARLLLFHFAEGSPWWLVSTLNLRGSQDIPLLGQIDLPSPYNTCAW